MAQAKTDVVILGGGVIGLACAYYLLCAGRSVTLIEQGQCGRAASHGNCGTLTPSHANPLAMPGMLGQALRWMLRADAPFYVRPRFDPTLWRWLNNFRRQCNWAEFNRVTALKATLLLQSRQLIETLIRQEHIDCEFETTGTLYAYRDERALAQSAWLPEALKAAGIEIETLDGRTLVAREPALNDSIVGGYWHPQDAHLRPDRYLAELARVVRERGGVIQENTRVTGFRLGRNGIDAVLTDQGERRADEVVLALGAWSPQLGRALGLRLPVQPGKGYSITYDRPEVCPRLPLVLRERSVCVTAWDSGFRLGSTMEFSGYDTRLNRVRLDALARGAAEYLTQPVGPRVREEWYGWRPMTYDDLPILGRSPAQRNLTLATGHGMLGVSLSAITGAVLAELLCGRTPPIDLAPFSATRFAS